MGKLNHLLHANTRTFDKHEVLVFFVQHNQFRSVPTHLAEQKMSDFYIHRVRIDRGKFSYWFSQFSCRPHLLNLLFSFK